MNIVTLTIFLIIVAFLGFCLLMAIGKIKDLERAKRILREEKSTLSDALRRKGIEVDRLEKKAKRLEKR